MKGKLMAMSEEEKNYWREALSFAARTDDPELMKAVYGVPDDPQEIECDDGPKLYLRTCKSCGETFEVTAKFVESIKEASWFNLCNRCMGKLAEDDLTSEQHAQMEKMFREIRGESNDSDS